MSHFKHHVFFCQNRREEGQTCCVSHDAERLQIYAKDRIKQMGLSGKGKIRVNKAGCMDRCDDGPVLVVYPDAVWYTFIDEKDIDEIIDSHLVSGVPVERLRLE